jgi:mono/diheme cytochrome c family protein
MTRRPTPSLPGVTRQSIFFRKKMDARVKPAHDEVQYDALTMRRRALIALLGSALASAVAAHGVFAADADEGKRLAQARCTPCHVVGPNGREELAKSPPFAAIARKFGFDADMLAFSILDPHPRMNMTLTRREAQDIAAYIATLTK